MAEQRTARAVGSDAGDEKGIQGTAPALAVQSSRYGLLLPPAPGRPTHRLVRRASGLLVAAEAKAVGLATEGNDLLGRAVLVLRHGGDRGVALALRTESRSYWHAATMAELLHDWLLDAEARQGTGVALVDLLELLAETGIMPAAEAMGSTTEVAGRAAGSHRRSIHSTASRRGGGES